MAKAHLTKIHKNRAKLGTLEILKGQPAPTISGYTLTFYHAVRRNRDDDNLSASCKAYRDGIASALGIDDHTIRQLASPAMLIDREKPRLEITLHPTSP